MEVGKDPIQGLLRHINTSIRAQRKKLDEVTSRNESDNPSRAFMSRQRALGRWVSWGDSLEKIMGDLDDFNAQGELFVLSEKLTREHAEAIADNVARKKRSGVISRAIKDAIFDIRAQNRDAGSDLCSDHALMQLNLAVKELDQST